MATGSYSRARCGWCPQDSHQSDRRRTPTLYCLHRLRCRQATIHSGGWQCKATPLGVPRTSLSARNESIQGGGVRKFVPQQLPGTVQRRARLCYSLRGRRQPYACSSSSPAKSPQQPLLDFEEESSSGSSGSGDEDPLNVLVKAQKKLRDSSTGRGNAGLASTLVEGKKDRSRYPLLSKGSRRKKEENHQDLNVALQAAGSAAAGSTEDPLRTLLALQMLETLKSKKTSRRRSPSSSASTLSSSSGTRERRSGKDKGAAKALRQYHESKRRMFKRPLKHVRRYLKEVEEQLGGGDDIPYRLVDYTRKIYWGKQRTLQRVHVLLHEILRLMLKNRFEEAALQAVLSLRAVHQCSLDNGRWDLAWLLTHVEDPFQRRRWGGETQEVEVVAAYVKALEDLEKKTRQTRFFDSGQPAEEEEQPEDKPGKGKQKGAKGSSKGQPNP